MQSIRIFISSPGDVSKERERAREVVESLRRRYSRHFMLQAVLWEDLPLQSDVSFQSNIDLVLSEKGVDIAIFILWSRLGSPLGHTITKPDGSPYLSGTEREYDLILRARAESISRGEPARPDILCYTRRDDVSFEESLRGTSTEKKEELIRQKRLVEKFLSTTFRDTDTGVNIGSYYPFDQPSAFARIFRTHLQGLLDQMVGESLDVIWDTDKHGPPFLGLEAFQPQHAAVFFGREEEVLAARHALREQALTGCAFLLLLGGSGSGKSSLAMAGVLPAITELETDEQVAGWRCLVVTPSQLGAEPVLSLVRRMAETELLRDLRENHVSLADLADGLVKDPELAFKLRLKDSFAKASAKHGGAMRLLLVIDQLEELFTSTVMSAAERSSFLGVVETFARSGCVWVIATARSDFYQQIQMEPALCRMKAGLGQLDVLPPGPDALARLVEEPARMAGISFESNDGIPLSNRIIKDAATHAELLPLVEFVLRELYELCGDTPVLTFAAYESLGGVEGALAKRADDSYNALPPDAQKALDGVLQALVTLDRDLVGADEKIVRQHATLADFASDSPARALIDAFIAARLFTTNQIESTHQATVSVAHESLLRVWPRARTWADNNRDFLHTRSRIAVRMQDGSPLLGGDPLLETAKASLLSHPGGFSPSQREWITQAAARAAAEEKRTLARRRLVFSSLAVLTVLSVAASLWAVLSERRSEQARKIAEQQRTVAQAERARAERSLELIGDAHAASTRMISDVLVDLRAKLEPSGQAGALADARQIINEHLDESIPPGNENDSLHMRAVVLDSRAYLARRVGDAPTAEKLYQESKDIRAELSQRNPGKAMYLHNEAVSHDNLGDCHLDAAVALRNMPDKSAEAEVRLGKALVEYRRSIDLSRKLATGDPGNPQWRHALAVGLFKLGNTLSESDAAAGPGEPLKVLDEGLKHAGQLASEDPSYAKWQAHLGLFHLEIGRILALSAEDAKARPHLEEGRRIFIGLRERKQLTHQYAEWLGRIETFLLDLGPPGK